MECRAVRQPPFTPAVVPFTIVGEGRDPSRPGEGLVAALRRRGAWPHVLPSLLQPIHHLVDQHNMNDVFITEDFLLQNDRAVELYHGFARDLPIIDYHCHLPPRQIAEDHRFANLAQIWLYGDHYKWRAMRSAGVAERYCTGDATRLGEVREVGRSRPQDAPQSALPLDPPGTEAALRHQRPPAQSRRPRGASGSSATRCLPTTACRAAASCGR